VIAVRANRHDLQQIGDLKGRRIAAVGRDWLGAYQAQAAELLAAGIDLQGDPRLTFTGEPHDRAIVEVIAGRADAGFVRTGVIEEMEREGKLGAGALRILGQRQVAGFPLLLSTRLYPEWPFAVAAHTPGRLASQVAVALLQMPAGDAAGRQGDYAGWTIPSDYHPVHELMRSLHLPPYDERTQFSWSDVVRRYHFALLTGLGLALLVALALVARFRLLNRTVTEQMAVISRHTCELENEVTARRAAEEGLRLSASVFEHSNDGILITDHENIIVNVNAAFTTITGYSREEALCRTPQMLQSGRQDHEFYREMWRSLNESGHWRGEIWNRRKSGDCYVELLDITAVKDLAGAVTHYVAIFSDITDMRDSQERLKLMAHYDPLTRLPNRALLADRLNQAVAMAQRDDHLLAVCFLDLDGFKPINDDHGHEIGDEMLVVVARRLETTLRAIDTVARLGGDEFVLLIAKVADMQELEAILGRLMAAIETPFVIGDLQLRVTASIGLTLYPLDDADPESLLRHADQAMYMAKRSGRSRYSLFDAGKDREAQSRELRTEGIRHALNEGEFTLHYQPKVDMRAGCVVGCEALIRWRHPQRGLVYPGEFLPLVEQSDLIGEVDAWVMTEAVRQLEAWHDAGLEVAVSVNVSARKLQSADFVQQTRELLARHPRVAPRFLEFEILESAALSDLEGVRETIRACQELGIQFSLDDFGTGYSSLSYLKRLPVDIIKIDQSFVRDLLDNPEDLAIVEGIVGLGRVFERRIVGEGVETPEHGVMLMRLGCDIAQGYGIARPMPADELPDWCRNFRANPQWATWAGVAWNIDDFPLLVAQSDHVKWVKGITRLVDGGAATLPPEEISDHHRCRFGRWYGDSGRRRYGGIREFAAIAPIHAEIHRIGSEIARRVSAGERAEARSQLPRLFELREAVRAHLALLQKAVIERW
jgi:diguanylate cyclase (GGDEF)-like protein/PAS domain S-box-containing protein